jgi:hypothetical protein
MSDTIRVVENDTLPDLAITLKDSNSGEASDPDSWDPIDLSAGTTSVEVKWRLRNTTAVLDTISCTKVDGGVNGQVLMPFGTFLVDNPAGSYEGEIIVTFDTDVQTVYDTLRMKIRADF